MSNTKQEEFLPNDRVAVARKTSIEAERTGIITKEYKNAFLVKYFSDKGNPSMFVHVDVHHIGLIARKQRGTQ